VSLAQETARKYETVVIFHPELNKDRISQEVNSIKQILTTNGAQEIQAVQWGKRELAYLAHKQHQGSYVVFEYSSANSKLVSALALVLRINDRLLKFQTHRINEHKRKFKGNPRRKAAQGGVEDELGFGDEEFS
jgi:small subunit ribosomal protein S6